VRIGVIGLGAIGGVVARRLLAQPRGDLIALAAGRHAAAIREHGLGEGVRADGAESTLPDLGAPYDLILLCTRTDATEEALRPALALLAPAGAVVCLQNGLPEDRAACLVGPARVLGAVIGWSASAAFEPGQAPRYWVTGGGKFTLGAVNREGKRNLLPASEVLARAFPVRVTHNLAGARWSKLSLNCAMSTLGAVSGLDLGGLAASSDARTLALRVVAEAVSVSRAAGVRLERIAGLDPAWLAGDGLLPHALIWLGARRRPRQRSGMLVRLLEGRTAGQVDDLNGAVVQAGRAHGVATPLNARLCALVHAIERGEERIGIEQLARLLA
jgi:2-dehydropantoate 2-reductase